MRLHTLNLCAFGPFPGAITVDLDALGASGLYLLHGDTGAGKTTLLDAVAFALFGRVPGARNDARRLRCDEAPPDVRTEVSLELSVGSQRLRVTRNPEYRRAKTRGSGTTVEKSKVMLRWIGSTPRGQRPEGLHRADEVGLAIADLIGMSADQFFQVVLLPQGDFARFLRADTHDRADVLERLFDTARFGSIEEWFAEARRCAAARLRAAEQRNEQCAARVAEAAGVEHVPTGPGEGAAARAALRDRLADRAALASETAAAARRHEERTAAEARRAERVLDRVRKRAALAGELRELDEQAPTLEAHRRSIERAARSADAMAAARRWRRREREHDDARRLRAACAAAVDGSGDHHDRPPAALHRAAAQARERAGALAGVLAEARRQDADLARLSAARSLHHRSRAELAACDEALAGLPERIATLGDQLELARSARDMAPVLAERLGRADEIRAAARSVPALRDTVQRAGDACVRAVDAHQRAVDARHALTERRFAGMAGELACALTPGVACPVCGSVDHPRRAVAGAGTVASGPASAATVTELDLATAGQAEQRAADRRYRLVDARAKAELALTHAVRGAARRTSEEAESEWKELATQLEAAQELAGRSGPAQRELDALRTQGEALRQQRAKVAERIATAAAVIDALRPLTEDRAGRLAEAAAPFADVAEHRAHLLAQADRLDELAQGSIAAIAAADALEVAASEVAAALAAAGFADHAEAVEAATVDVDALARAVRAAEDRRTAVLARLRDLGRDVEPADPPSDLAEETHGVAARAAAGARSAAERAAAEAHAARARLDQTVAASRRWQVSEQAVEPLAQTDATLSALTDVMLGRGQNALGISLRTYVLAAKLAEVAEVAGQRLRAMSAGRYSFVPVREREARGKAGGLGLDVLDGWSGRVRPTKTLSGGESFLASLALALGLADVVSAACGGRVLDTIFIDEGFGSLDAESLDMVMETLDGLRAGGRVVGLVSHLDELRQRIPDRLLVRRHRGGSTVQLTAS